MVLSDAGGALRAFDCRSKGTYNACMHRIRHIEQPPANLDEFVDEMAYGLGQLYGAVAEAEYRGTASGQIRRAMGLAVVDTIAIFEGRRAMALLMAVVDEDAGRISMIHVLGGSEEQGMETSLIEESVSCLRGGGVHSIVCEFIPLCPLELDRVFEALGFTRISRALMETDLVTPSPTDDAVFAGRCLSQSDTRTAAEIIVSSYRDHPDQLLHTEITNIGECVAYIERVREGSYGPTAPEYLRVIDLDGVIRGVLLGCETSRDVGFILQINVEPEFQGRGLGTRLISDIRRQFRLSGLDKIALGVSLNNPAFKLYEGLGFSMVRNVNVYVWRRRGHMRPASIRSDR